jgi:hypothetical protein
MKLRALRRHHRERLRRRWTPLIKWMFYLRNPPSPLDKEILDRQVHIHVRTRKPCSCWVCSGWRRWMAGPTRQELLDQLGCREQLDQLTSTKPEFDDPDEFYEPDFAQMANSGLNDWLASLPDDDWGDSLEHGTSIHLNEETGEFEELIEDPT